MLLQLLKVVSRMYWNDLLRPRQQWRGFYVELRPKKGATVLEPRRAFPPTANPLQKLSGVFVPASSVAYGLSPGFILFRNFSIRAITSASLIARRGDGSELPSAMRRSLLSSQFELTFYPGLGSPPDDITPKTLLSSWIWYGFRNIGNPDGADANASL